MVTRILGIDLAVTAKHKAIILDPASGRFLTQPISFRALPDELDKLLAKARAQAPADLHLVAILEATGMAWYPVSVYLHSQGVQVHRVNGRQTRELRRVYWRQASSDRIDARVLAQLYQLAPERFAAWQAPSGEQLALQRLCREFARWRELDVAIQNRLHSYDHWAWGGLGWLTAQARDWVRQHYYDPWLVQASDLDTLCTAWQAAAPKTDSDWLSTWYERARQMTQLYGDPSAVGYPDLQAAVRRNRQLREQCQQQQAYLREQHIQPLYRRLYPERWLETIPGIGADSAALYMAFIHTIERFPTIAQFRQWCGLSPKSKQSGQAQSQGLSITQAGPNLVKATLYLNADVARQCDVQIAQVYYTQMVNYGKHHTQAVCACATHLANRIFAVLSQQRPYERRDAHDNPIDAHRARQLCQTHFKVPEHIRQRNSKRNRQQQVDRRAEQRFQSQALPN